MKWNRKFEEESYVCAGKSLGRPGISEEDVDKVRKAIQHSPKAMRKTSQELNIPNTSVANLSQTFTSEAVQAPSSNYITYADIEFCKAFYNERMEDEGFRVTNGGHIEYINKNLVSAQISQHKIYNVSYRKYS